MDGGLDDRKLTQWQQSPKQHVHRVEFAAIFAAAAFTATLTTATFTPAAVAACGSAVVSFSHHCHLA